MKAGTEKHPKTSALMALIHKPRYAAVGILEMLWKFVHRYAPQGDIGRWPASAIEAAIEWDGEPGALVAALTAARWLDERAPGGLIVHDWPEHCEDSVHVALARKGLYFTDGSAPKLNRLSKKEREEIESAFRAHRSARKRTKARTEPAPETHYQAVPSQAVPSQAVPSRAVPDRPAFEPHPLIPDPETRKALELEYFALIREIAKAWDKDPTQVATKFGEWKGSRKLKPDLMTPDRLINVVQDMRNERDRLKGGGAPGGGEVDEFESIRLRNERDEREAFERGRRADA